MRALPLIRYACGGAILGVALFDLLGWCAGLDAHDLTSQIVGALVGGVAVLAILDRD